MTELIDVRADAVGPGEAICLGGAASVVTAVERRGRTVEVHTCYGPAVRLAGDDVVSVIVESEVA